VSEDCLKLTVYFGESDRVGRHLLSDALLDAFARRSLHASLLLRATEGFGVKQTLRTDRFLTLSEGLPLVAVAVDRPAAIEEALPEVTKLVEGGLVTVERARLVQGGDGVANGGAAAKLTIQLGRNERVGGRPAFAAVVDHLRAHGLTGATVLLGVDGTEYGQRRRARFFARNDAVPALVVSVGSTEAVVEALAGLRVLARDPILLVEQVGLCKRDGELIAVPPSIRPTDSAGLDLWQKLTVYGSEQARHDGRPQHLALIAKLRAAGAAGATSLRGPWGYSGDHAPHGDRLLGIRRNVPVVTTVIDRPEETQRWFAIVDECTSASGLVTSEIVPAFRAVAPGARVGGLRLADPGG
jgi:PII-like signaling protein